jgi:hypothetical protein
MAKEIFYLHASAFASTTAAARTVKNRIFRFYGQAFSAAITVKFNNVEIFSGPVPSNNSPMSNNSSTDTIELLFEYVGTTDLSGNIPFELHVTNGTVFFGAVEANYTGFAATRDRTAESSWPSEFVVIEPPENCWADVNQNSIETDGKTNVQIDGVEQIRQVIDPDQATGDWWYRISENETFTCDIFVDPDCILTEIPETFLPRQN